MKTLSRSTALKIAAVLSFLFSAFSFIGALPVITQGAAAINQNANQPPFAVSLIGFVSGVMGIIGAYPTWRGQRIGVVLTILANLVAGLSAAPGLLFAPNPMLLAAASVSVVLTVAIIVLCLWRDRKPVLA